MQSKSPEAERDHDSAPSPQSHSSSRISRTDWSSRSSTGIRRRALTSSDTRTGLGVLTLDGVFSNIYVIIISGAFLSGFALVLGMNDFHLGLLGAIPTFANVMGLAGAYMAERMHSRKRLVIPVSAISRLLWIPLLALPFLPLEPTQIIWSFLALYLVVSLFAGLANNVWQGWVSDLVPEQLRGRYFGHRNRMINLGSIAAMLGGGLLLDWGKHHGHVLLGYTVLFGTAVIFGAVSLETMRRQYEPSMKRLSSGGFWENASKPLRDIEFRRLLAGFGVLHFGLGFSAPFFVAYTIKNLDVSYTILGMFVVVSLTVGMFFHVIWGAVMDHSGVRSAMLLNLSVIAGIPILYVLSLTGGLGFIWAAWFLTGVCWSGFAIASLNLPFALSPRAGRAYYLAMLNVVTGFSFFFGSTLSGSIAHHIEAIRFTLFGVQFVHYHLLFLMSSLLRFSALLLLRRVKDTKSRGMMPTIQITSEIVYSKLMILPSAAARLVRIGRRQSALP